MVISNHRIIHPPAESKWAVCWAIEDPVKRFPPLSKGWPILQLAVVRLPIVLNPREAAFIRPNTTAVAKLIPRYLAILI